MIIPYPGYELAGYVTSNSKWWLLCQVLHQQKGRLFYWRTCKTTQTVIAILLEIMNWHARTTFLCRNASRFFRKNYFCGANMQCSDHISSPQVNLVTWRSNKAKETCLCNNGWFFLLFGSHRIYETIMTATVGEKLVCRAKGFDLNFDSFGLSRGFVDILYSSRLILLYNNHLEGRQTVEKYLVHIGIC